MAMSGTLDPRCAKLDLPERVYANMVRLDDGSILTVADNAMLVSEDDGKSWCERGPVYTGPPPGVPGERHAPPYTERLDRHGVRRLRFVHLELER